MLLTYCQASVRLSVCLSVCLLVRPFVPPFGRRTPLRWFCCCGPGGQEISIEQNILARVAAGAPWTSSSLNIRRDLHWLPVGHRITYKPCLSTLNTLQTSQPLLSTCTSLNSFLTIYLRSRSLRSPNTNLLTRPLGITSKFSYRAFSVFALSTWNSLPAHIRSINTLSNFKRYLKFHLFQSAFTV